MMASTSRGDRLADVRHRRQACAARSEVHSDSSACLRWRTPVLASMRGRPLREVGSGLHSQQLSKEDSSQWLQSEIAFQAPLYPNSS